MTSLIVVNNALCRIGRHLVLRIDRFEIGEGQHWCVFGLNGSGKSLLANLIAGKRVESGKYVSYADHFDPSRDIHIVSFEEQQRLWQRDNRLDISEYSDNAQDKGTLVEQLIRITRSSEHQDDALFGELIEQLDLNSVVDQGIRFLSSGQIRRVLIARALYAHRRAVTKLLILDDPLESIDKDSQQRIAHCLEQFMGSHCCSLQLCRRPQDILPAASHLTLMNELKMVSQGRRSWIIKGELFRQLVAKKPSIAKSLPPRLAGSDEFIENSEPLIRLGKVSANYGDLLVLDNIQWAMQSHHHVLIEGPNGCGKSTLLSLIDGENHKGYGQNVFLFRVRGSVEQKCRAGDRDPNRARSAGLHSATNCSTTESWHESRQTKLFRVARSVPRTNPLRTKRASVTLPVCFRCSRGRRGLPRVSSGRPCTFVRHSPRRTTIWAYR